MTLTASNMMPLGTKAPNFTLLDTMSDKTRSLPELASQKATVMIFLCNHCPYVKHIQTELVKLANDYMPQGISFIAISANDIEAYPEDAPLKLKETALKLHYPFPLLFDKTQAVAKAYQAACTPDFYIFDGDLKCVYRGQFDDSRPGNNIPVTGKDIRDALDNILSGSAVSAEQRPSIGCNIKWK